MAESKEKKPEKMSIKVSYETWEKLTHMKIDLVGNGTYDDLLQKFIESEGY